MAIRGSLLGALVAIVALAIATEDAQAFWGSRGSHGSWGSNGSHGSFGSRGSHGSFGSHGSRGGLFRRLFGSHGSHGSFGSHGSHGSHHGSHGSHGSHGGYAVANGGESYARSQPAVKTSLTLNVPADAKVTLAGVETKQTGEVRQFTTSTLASGQAWENYTIEIELERDGQVLREERTITLTGGQSQELSIEFDSVQLAQL